MTTRKKRGRTVVVSPPTGQDHGRPLATTPAVRTRLDPGDPAERLAFALVQAHLRRRGVKVGATERAIKARIERARVELRETPTGAEEARSVTTGLTANGGALLRTVERAAPDARDFATRAAVRFVALVREHRVTSTAALVSLASAAQWSALGEMLRDECFALGVNGEGLGERLKTAAAASTAARLDLLGGLQLEREAKDAQPPPVPWLNVPVIPPGAPEPEDEHEPAQDAEYASAGDVEPVRDPDEAPEADEHGEYENRFSYSEPERVPHASEPPAGAVPGVGRTRAAASLAPRTHDAQGRLIVPTGGPSQSARAEMLKKFGQVFDDATGRWVKESKS